MEYGFQIVGARPKGQVVDPPTAQPMRAGPDKIRRAPSTDQLKVRREMARGVTKKAEVDRYEVSPHDAVMAAARAAILRGRTEAKRIVAAGPQEHQFNSTGECYDETQTNEDIKSGDVLIIEAEGVAGFLLSAWPVAVTAEFGDLHQQNNPSQAPAGQEGDTPEEIAAWAAGWAKAREIATSKGWPLDGEGTTVEASRRTAVSETVYGLYRTDPMVIEMIAPSVASAKMMRAMFGPAWKARKLTADEIQTPWVQGEIATLREEGMWVESKMGSTASRKTAGPVVLTDEQRASIREVSGDSLRPGDKIFKPGMGTIMMSYPDGQVRFQMGVASIDGSTFTVKSNEGGILTATGDQDGKDQSGPNDRRWLKLASLKTAIHPNDDPNQGPGYQSAPNPNTLGPGEYWDDDDEYHPDSCPQCGGPSMVLGDMGSTVALRCRNCGWTYSMSKHEGSRKTAAEMERQMVGEFGVIPDDAPLFSLGDRSYYVDVYLAPGGRFDVVEGAADATGGIMWENEVGSTASQGAAENLANRIYNKRMQSEIEQDRRDFPDGYSHLTEGSLKTAYEYDESAFLNEALSMTQEQAQYDRYAVGVWSQEQYEAFMEVWARNKAYSSVAENWRAYPPTDPEVVRLVGLIEQQLAKR